MKRTFKVDNIGCANCAAKIETAVAELPGVNAIRLNFMTSKLILDADDDKFADLLEETQKIATKYEPDFMILK